MRLKILLLSLLLGSTLAHATVPVVRYPSGTPVQVCQPSDSNTNCGGTSSGTVTNIATTAPITGGPITTTGTIACNVASASQPGCLSSADWSTFNSKGSGTVTSVTCGTGLSGGTITTSGTCNGINAVADGSTKGISTYTATDFTDASGVISGRLTLVSGLSPSSQSAVTISGLTTGKQYILYLDVIQNTSNGFISITFNSDTTGTHYLWQKTSNFSTTVVASYSTTNTIILSAGNGVVATFAQHALFYFLGTGNNVNYMDFDKGEINNGGTTPILTYLGGKYNGAATLSSITLTDSAGTFTGVVRLYTVN